MPTLAECRILWKLGRECTPTAAGRPVSRLHPRIVPTRPQNEATFPATVLGVWRFDGALSDLVGQEDFSPSTGSSVYTTFDKFELLPNLIQNRSGLQFEENKTYSASPLYSYPNDFTLSFWYFSPGLVGFTRHFSTRELEPKVAPIIAKSDFATTSTQTTLSQASFVATEVAYSKTQNAVRVYLSSDGTNISHVITSDPYTPGLHQVLMTYSRSSGRFRVDIDGKTGIQHSAPSSSLNKVGAFRINDVVPGFLAHKTTQTGAYIFDLVFTTYVSIDNESLKAFRYGYEHISHDDLFDARFTYFGMSYAQPNTISTTQVFVDGGNIFSARSNGKIVQGASPIWDKEFNYQDTNSVALLSTSETDAVSVDPPIRFIAWSEDGLKLQGVSVRI